MSARLGAAGVRQKQAQDIAERLWLAARLKVLTPRRTFSMNDAVDVALFLTDKLFKSAGIRVQTKLNPDIPEVDAQMGHIEQALVNVLLNACEATHRGGTVRVSTDGLDGNQRVQVRIEDTGEGMSQESLEKAFDPFYSTKGHLGVGLSAAREMVLGFGGNISMESAVGEGTKVFLRLPAVGR